jgi:nucleoside-diphosphate-sugar epimerase
MRVALTGHQGFVGHHIGAALICAGHEVYGIDDFRSEVKLARRGIHFTEEIRRDFACINFSYEFDEDGVDVLVHCGAYADVSRNWDSNKERDKVWENNVSGTRFLLENTSLWIPRVIFISTLAVKEDVVSPYAASKIAGEALVRAYAESCAILRLASVVGEGYHHGHIADFVRAAKDSNGRGIKARSNGKVAKSMVHALDVADVVCKALEQKNNIVHELSGGDWSPRDTVRVMGCEAEWAEEDFGWKGDTAPRVKRNCERSIESGVRDVLTSLGWP